MYGSPSKEKQKKKVGKLFRKFRKSAVTIEEGLRNKKFDSSRMLSEDEMNEASAEDTSPEKPTTSYFPGLRGTLSRTRRLYPASPTLSAPPSPLAIPSHIIPLSTKPDEIELKNLSLSQNPRKSILSRPPLLQHRSRKSDSCLSIKTVTETEASYTKRRQ
jgi:hypothetical protein